MLNETATQEGTMARKKQGYKARLDESLGERRGKESGKKQSYAARRHESEAMEKHYGKRPYSAVSTMDKESKRKRHYKRHNEKAHDEADETQMYHKGKEYYGAGYGEPSNLPQEPIHKKYPEPYPRLKLEYPDTLEEIDEDMMDSFRKVEDYRSDSMY